MYIDRFSHLNQKGFRRDGVGLLLFSKIRYTQLSTGIHKTQN